MALTDAEVLDLAETTLKELGPLRFNQIAQTLQDHEFFSHIFRKDKAGFEGGTGIERKVMVTTSGNASNVGLFNTDTINVGDVMKTITIPWRHTTTKYAFDRRELLMNRSRSKIVSLLESRRVSAMIDKAELMEADSWAKPATSADEVTPFGLTYWIVKNTTTGFNGGNATGFTAGPAGLDSTAFPTWKNYTAQYVNLTKADAIKKLRTAHRKINFKSPIDIKDLRTGRGDQYRLYVNEATISAMEDIGEAQNENLGRDLAPMDGTIAFKRNPIVWVPQLDTDSSNPIYMLNFGYFNPVFLKGDYLRETKPALVANMHNVMAVHVDTTWNILCTDRRRQAVIHV